MKLLHFFLLLLCFSLAGKAQAQKSFSPYTLIAHRGGVVSETAPENSLAALDEAISRGYYMVEIDMRLTKDSVLITQHDPHFKKYFNTNELVSDMNWEQIKALSHPTGYRVMLLEEVLAYCEGKIQVMIDNKISGYDEKLFSKVVELLQKYGLDKEALMIGTTASTEFFTGKIKLSCTRHQLEQNQLRADYTSENYYLFAGDISAEDAHWAKENNIMTVAAVNAFTFPKDNMMRAAKERTELLKANGLLIFQIDSVFEPYF